MGMMELRRLIIAGGRRSELPAEYSKLPYITADGNQSLRLDYVPVQNDEFHCRFTIGSNYGTKALISAGTGSYQLVLLTMADYAGFFYRYFSAGSAARWAASYVKDTWYDIDIDKTGLCVSNGASVTCPYGGALDGNDTTLWLFQRRNATSNYIGSMSEFWITNNGEYKVKLIPCLRKSDNKAGMYDTVSKTFYGSSLNDFIADN